MKKFIFLLTLGLAANLTLGQYYDSLNINNVKTRINASNIQFCQLDSSNNPPPVFEIKNETFEFPKNSGKHTIFSSSLWFSGKNLNDHKLVSADRYMHSGEEIVPDPLNSSGNIHPDTIKKYRKVWTITQAEIDSFKKWISNPSALPSYQPSNDLLTWPAGTKNHPIAPFIDVNNDQKYKPLSDGDYPEISGDKAIFFVLNDVGGDQPMTGHLPLKLEIHCMFYAYHCPASDAINNTIFANYEIVNYSGKVYQNFKPSLFIDFDIGNPYNDFAGTDVLNGMGYAYNAPGSINNILGDTAYASGAVILKGPKMSDNQKDDPLGSIHAINGNGFADGIVDNEYFGLTNSIYSLNIPLTPPALSDPVAEKHYYYRARSHWNDKTHLQYSGNGYDSSTINCRYMFPDESDSLFYGIGFQTPPGNPYWKADTNNLRPQDIRIILSSGSNNYFLPNETITLDVAFTNAMIPGGTNDQVIDRLQSYADSLQYYYSTNTHPCGNDFVLYNENPASTETNITVYPNPATQKITVKTNLKESYRISLYNLKGEKLKTKPRNTGNSNIDIRTLSPGIYLLEIRSETQHAVKRIIKN